MKRLLATIGLVSVFVVSALGQWDWSKPVTVSVSGKPLPVVLKSIFDQAGLPFDIQKGISGLVTIEGRNVPFNVVRREILQQNDLVSDLVNDVWTIRKEKRLPTSSDTSLVHPSSRLAENAVIVRVDYDQADIHLVLKELFRSAGRGYTVDPKLNGFVTIGLRNLPFDRVLSLVLRQVDGAYRIEVGQKYEIFRIQHRNE